MPQEEIYGTRDESYSAWHRRNSTRRFVGIESAQLLAMIDVDIPIYVEYDDKTKEPLGIFEVAKDVGQSFKASTVTQNLAKRCTPTLPGYVVLYKLSEKENPANSKYKDIEEFRAKRLWPDPENNWKKYTPKEWAIFLLELRKWSAHKVDKEYENKLSLF